MAVLGGGSAVLGGTFQATASGAIANGKACIINANGTVSQAAAVGGKHLFLADTSRIYRYKLATAYDLSEVLGPTGAGDYSTAVTAGTPWEIDYFGYTYNQEQGIRKFDFKSDGLKLFITGYQGDDINEYTLSTAYDISTATFVDAYDISAKVSDPNGMDFKPDGTEVYISTVATAVNVYQYTLSTAWDISTASFTRELNLTTTPAGERMTAIKFKPDGTKMYVSSGGGSGTDDIFQFSLSTAWDISTASYDTVVIDTSSYQGSTYSITFNDDGTKIYSVDYDGANAVTFSLSTAYDLSTASFVAESPNLGFSYPTALVFGPGGSATSDNYIGISQGAVSNGETASIKVIGGIDTNQSGLTPNALCYINDSGTIVSTDNGVVAGQALSPTTVLIKNQYDVLFD